jgi:septal ring factor EnvC (AmiA/AmiB activator)
MSNLSSDFYAALFAFLGVAVGYYFKHVSERLKLQVSEKDFWQYIKELQKELFTLQQENKALSSQIAELQEELTKLQIMNEKLLASNTNLQALIETRTKRRSENAH